MLDMQFTLEVDSGTVTMSGMSLGLSKCIPESYATVCHTQKNCRMNNGAQPCQGMAELKTLDQQFVAHQDKNLSGGCQHKTQFEVGTNITNTGGRKV